MSASSDNAVAWVSMFSNPASLRIRTAFSWMPSIRRTLSSWLGRENRRGSAAAVVAVGLDVVMISGILPAVAGDGIKAVIARAFARLARPDQLHLLKR
jgi:hypothetical protein